MNYYESEILNKLEVGKRYTPRQLRIFLNENKETAVVSKSCYKFLEWQDNLILVLGVIEGYLHTSDVQSKCYRIPSCVKKIYIIE